jgi:integrase
MIVRIRGVKRVRSKGRIYHYHRATMARLPGEPGSTAFQAALERLNRGASAQSLPGTLGALVSVYRASPEFLQRSARTRQIYDEAFDYLRPIAGMPLIQVDAGFLYGVRDKAAAQRKRWFANALVRVLRLLFAWAMKRGHAERNPAVAVEQIAASRNAPVRNRPWRPDELDVVMAEAPAWMRTAIALGAYAGLREADMMRATWSSYDGTAIEIRQQKTGRSVWVPAHSSLREILDAAPRVSPVILVGAKGTPFANRGSFQSQFFKLIRRLKAEGKISPGLSFHGLRHTLGTALAEEGCDPRTIASILGQSSDAIANHYSRNADRRGLAGAAIAKLERPRN